VLAAVLVSACGGDGEAPQAAAPPPSVRVGAESVARADVREISTGPILSGQLAAERQATVRAEVGGSIVNVSVEEGERVGRGQLLARIEARDLTEAAASAAVAVKAAENALALARSELQRTEMLVKGGALAERDLDTARNAVATAESELAAARARQTSARQELADTSIRAPIGGVVSRRAVNGGDVVQPGAEIVTIIDPSSMRLEAAIPADRIGEVRVGAPVRFEVRGYPGQTFTGRVERISPAADPATRQVPIFVTIPNAGGRLIAGLFAEGRVSSERRRALVVPASAVGTTGDQATVTRVSGGKAERVNVTLGLRDPESELVEIKSGLTEGDLVLTGASRTVADGTPVQVAEQ
jgi:RND family efflux transporter MFP subunit